MRARPSCPPIACKSLGAEAVGLHLRHVLAKAHSGMVFKASDSKNREFAVKVLWPEFSRDDAEVQRFIAHEDHAAVAARQHRAAVRRRQDRPLLLAGYGIRRGRKPDTRHRASQHRRPAQLEVGFADHDSGPEHFDRHSKQIIHRNITPQNISYRARPNITKLSDLMFAKAWKARSLSKSPSRGELLGDVRYHVARSAARRRRDASMNAPTSGAWGPRRMRC